MDGFEILERYRHRLDFANKLIDWYWTLGYRRRHPYQLPLPWLPDLYAARDQAIAAGSLVEAARPALAVWGLSQSGKSTLLSYFIDSQRPGDTDSALNWDPRRPFRFLPKEDMPAHIGSLNPANAGSDASGCVTRFFLADHVPDPERPVTLTLASRPQILHSVAAGYLQECRQDVDGQVRFWDVPQLTELLQKADAPQGGAIDRAAFETVADCVAVCDRLIDDQYDRYKNLAAQWTREIRPSLLANAALRSSLQKTEHFVFTLLWDNREKMSLLFRRIDEFRLALVRQFGEVPVYTSLAVASLLLDIESYRVLTGGPDIDIRRTQKIADLAGRIGWKRSGDHILIDAGLEGGTALFRSVEDYGLFQSLVWEIGVPLSSAYLRQHPVHEYLERMDILDIPGVARSEAGGEQAGIDLVSDPNVDTATLLTRAVKRGKTASIISRYAHWGAIDGILLLHVARDGFSKSQAAQITGGINAICRGLDPAYLPGKAPPPLAVSICFTFINQLIDEQAHIGSFDLGPLLNRLEPLGPIALPEFSQLYMLSYPHLPRGTYNVASLEARQYQILPALLSQRAIRARFQTELEKKSIEAALTAPDGGVSYLLEAISRFPPAAVRLERAAARLRETEQRLENVARAAAPQRDDETEARRRGLRKLIDEINVRLDNSSGRGFALAEEISAHLRIATTIEASDLQTPPRSMIGNQQEVIDYLLVQLGGWAQRSDVIDALGHLGLTAAEAGLVIRALHSAVNLSEAALWCERNIVPEASVAKRNHMRRYIAAKLMRQINREPNSGAYQESQLSADEEIERKFNSWEDTSTGARNSPHFKMIIENRLRLFERLANETLGRVWEPQPGDNEIGQLFGQAQTWS
jgi:hypothetical protein